ncbi:O-antigen ligase family protein [Marinobacter sp. V034]|uniref:O-antigen ligase family protein n=1 Tax=Marinobacter sp. V034 TaxID=3459610 RepID=UPI004043D32B
MVQFKAKTARSTFLLVPVLLVFMLTPAFGVFKVWPLPSAMSAGLTLFCVGLFFGIMLLTRRDSTFRFNTAVFLFLGLLAVLAVSVALNSYAYETAWRWYLIAFIVCVMALVAASELKAYDPQKFYNTLSHFLWAGCFIYAAMSLLKYYGLLTLVFSWVEPGGGRLSGVWGQSNLTTTTCWLGLLAGAVVFSRKERKGWWYASILIFGWTLASAASRMSWLMVTGLLALIFVSYLSRYRAEDTLGASRMLLRGVVLVVILLFVAPLLNQPLREALVSFGLLDGSSVVSLAGRDVFHDGARLTELVKLFSVMDTFSVSQWFFGVGPGHYPAFSYHADMLLPPEGLIAGTWLHSHNLFSMIFVEFGLVGLVVLVAFVVSIALAALKAPMNLRRFFSIGAIGLLFIHSNLEFPLWNLWFLVLLCLLMTNLFDVKELKGDSKWLKPVAGICGLLMVLALLVNVGYQYSRIVDVALNSQRDKQDYQALAFLANDSLMGPYAVLRKYRDFAPEAANIDWQLQEVRRMKAWQPRDLVVLREFSLLILKQDMREACKVAEQAAYRYPSSGPIMLDHSLLAEVLSPGEITEIANCIEKGLAPRGETILSMQIKNQAEIIK